MNKDIIYIDVEDDITAIIGKIKASHDKIVALVPPKRIGVFQSAVNLRLLARTAENSHKHLVLITNNQALIALSAIAKIPIAKNLQSKPEIAEIAALEIDEGEDVIDGSQLPVGELERTADIIPEADIVNETIETMDIESDIPKQIKPTSKMNPKSNVKVPDFSLFRKRLFLSGLLLPFIIGFFVWAILYAPYAKIIITAKTSSVDISKALKLGGTVATDVTKNIVQTIVKQAKKDISVDFTATGTKDLGVKASGSIMIRNCDLPSEFTLASGTQFTNSSGQVYVSTASVSVPGFTGPSSSCTFAGDTAGKASVNVQAVASGDTYNNEVANVIYTIGDSVVAAANVDAIGIAMTGGTTRIATVVKAEDIQKAGQALVDLSTDSYKQQLIGQFTNGESVIPESFAVDRAAAVSVPAVGEEAVGGKAKLTSATTFSITAIAKSELELFLKDVLNKQIGTNKNQRMYEDGIDKITLSGYLKTDTSSSVNIATSGTVGPNIDPASIKEEVKGMQFGDIQILLGRIQGVSNVDTKFSYFWVNTVPNDSSKIDVELVLQNE